MNMLWILTVSSVAMFFSGCAQILPSVKEPDFKKIPVQKNSVNDKYSFTNESVLKHLSPVIYEEGNDAFTKDSPYVNGKLLAWSKQMSKKIQESIPNKVYLASGFQLCSTLIINGKNGLIIVDPGENDLKAKETLETFRKVTKNNKKISAVIYSHRHPDHAFGAKGFGVSQEDVSSGRVKIIAADNFMHWLKNDASVVGTILSQRTAYSGPLLDKGAKGFVNDGLGATFSAAELSFYKPTTLVHDKPLTLNIEGEEIVLFKAYGDAEDEIDLYLPKYHHVHGSETIQGESFPNLYTLRGTKYRDLVKWYKGVDTLLEYAKKANTYSGSHMRAWKGNSFIVKRITNYRDAIQYVHDRSVYYMNQGAKREELVDLVKLPKELKNDPWLQEFYGTVAHSTQNVFNGYLGWYQGDATELARPHFKRRAIKYVEAMGGRDSVINQAKEAINQNDYGWAADILTSLVRANYEDKEAKGLKALALRQWGYLQENIYWRNQALTAAQELEGTINFNNLWNFANPVIISQFPVKTILENLRVNLDPKKANKNYKINFNFRDLKEKYSYEFRNKIAVFHDYGLKDASASITLDHQVLLDILFQKVTLQDAIKSKRIVIKGDMNDAKGFLGSFKTLKFSDIKLIR